MTLFATISYHDGAGHAVKIDVPQRKDGSDPWDIFDAVQTRLFPQLTREEKIKQTMHADAVLRKFREIPREGYSSAAQGASYNGGRDSVVTAAGPLHAIAQTSRDAYAKVKASGQLTRQQQQIMDVVKPGETYTRSELEKLTGLKINVITARVAELRAMKQVIVLPKPRSCSVTGETVQCLRRTIEGEIS